MLLRRSQRSATLGILGIAAVQTSNSIKSYYWHSNNAGSNRGRSALFCHCGRWPWITNAATRSAREILNIDGITGGFNFKMPAPVAS